MAGLKPEHINPFLTAATQILRDMCFVEASIGKPYIKEAKFKDDTMIIIIGVTGEMRGQVLLTFANTVACDIASKMCMMPVEKMDALSTSAICELGNMVMGNTATVFSTQGIGIDITPPTVCTGDVQFSAGYAKNICIPVSYDDGKVIEFHISLKEE